MRKMLVPTIALFVLVGLACGEDDNGLTEVVITTGSIEVLLTMSGSYLDPDGCQVSVDGGDFHALEPEGSVTFTDLAPETHTVLLDDVAANCTVEGQNPRDAEVEAGQTVQTTYRVECTPCGAGYGPYQAVDLGTLGGDHSGAYGINNHGQVVGFSISAAGGRAFLWEDGVMIDLGTLGGISGAYAINDHGQVVGVSGTPTDKSHAFLWEDGVMIDLGTLGGGRDLSSAADINNLGQVVGNSGGAYESAHAFLWEDGAMIDLGTLGGDYESSWAKAINDSGQVVGYVYSHDRDDRRAFLWEDGVMIDLGTPSGSDSQALDINNRGQVLGHWGDPLEEKRYFVWQDGVMTDLGIPISSYPSAIDNCGQVAGLMMFEGYHHAFLWEDGVMTNLGIADSMFSSREVGMNDAGQVVGQRYWDASCGSDDCDHAALWTRSY